MPNRSEKVRILAQFLAGQPSRLVELKRVIQSANNGFVELTDEELKELEQQIAEHEAEIAKLDAELLAAGIEKTAEDIALDNQIAWLKARMN